MNRKLKNQSSYGRCMGVCLLIYPFMHQAWSSKIVDDEYILYSTIFFVIPFCSWGRKVESVLVVTSSCNLFGKIEISYFAENSFPLPGAYETVSVKEAKSIIESIPSHIKVYVKSSLLDNQLNEDFDIDREVLKRILLIK
mmetsp:Transcript_21861/g.19913  ORF Transcript_21861/g.19913 Transcript_21861/m.19913 type:complete len:140 (+) Transcript_21861:202-621(+)